MNDISRYETTKRGYMANYIKFLANNGFIGIGGMPIGALLAYYGVMTVFMTSLGYGSIAISVVNAIFYLGFALSQVPSAYFLESKTIKKTWMGILQLSASGTFLVFGLILTLIGDGNSLIIILLFVVFYSMGTSIGGSAIPTQFALFNKIVPPEKLGKLLGIMFVVNSLAGMFGGWIVSRVFSLWPVDRANPDFSLTAFKVLFIASFLFVLAAAVVIWTVREQEGEKIPKKENFPAYVSHTMGFLKQDANLARFLVGKNLMFGQYAAKLFYATYAISNLGVPAKYAGLFISFFLGGFCTAGLTLARLADRYGPKFMLILSQVLAFLSLMCAIFSETTASLANPLFLGVSSLLNIALEPMGMGLVFETGYHNVFYIVFFLAGLSAICDNIGYSNMAFQSCPSDDKTTYVGLVNLFAFILPVIMPFVFGGLEKAGALTIRAVFVINAFVMIAAIAWLYSMVDNPAGFTKLKNRE